MILRMRFFRKFVVENVRNGAVEADGKPARAKRNGISLAGCPKTSNFARDARGKPENVRRSARQFAGSPKTRNWAREACGKAARKIRKE